MFPIGLDLYLRVPKDGYKMFAELIFLWDTAFVYLNDTECNNTQCLKLLPMVTMENSQIL